jgi:hypothetical protein
MLMLTHTYILQNLLNEIDDKKYDLDIFVYNIIPDLLTVHPDITSAKTHKIKRTLQYPPQYPKSAYVMLHLLIDDLAHFGTICPDIPDEFNPESQGYSYIKGRPLIDSLLRFQKKIGREISYNEAAYRSHLVVEMIYDLIILDHITHHQSIKLLADAVSATANNYMDEFTATIGWLYGLQEADIRDVIKKASIYLTTDRMQNIMNIDGRIRLYIDKFGLRDNYQEYFNDIKCLFLQAMELLNDNEMFLRESAATINKYGWLPPLKQPS